MSESTNPSNNSDCFSNEDIKCMFEQIIALLGNVGEREIDEQIWCLLLKSAVEEYVTAMEMWLIQNQWGSLSNKGFDMADICYALTTRTLNLPKQYANAYSAEVGLQSGGNGEFVLKKDFITLQSCKQVYEIPSGREINEVLWTESSPIDQAMSNANSGVYGNNNGFGNTNSSHSTYGQGISQYMITPAYDTVLRAADYRLKQKFLGLEAHYKVTAGADGKKYIHLINGNTGTSIDNSSCGGCNKCSSCSNISKCKVWYHYYDTSPMTEEQRDECLKSCADIVKYPFEVPLEQTNFCDLNAHSKTWVRKYLTALVKERLGNIRGKFGGTLPSLGNEVTLDYSHFFSEAQAEKESLMTQLSTFLETLTSVAQLTKQADEAEALQRILNLIPTGMFIK